MVCLFGQSPNVQEVGTNRIENVRRNRCSANVANKYFMTVNITSETRFYIAGHRGMVGSAIVKKLRAAGFNNIITRSHDELDLTNQQSVSRFFAAQQIDHVVLAAAKVGGIHANNEYPAEFIYQNLMIESNVIHEAYQTGVKKLLFLGSSCIYPKLAEQPMQEDALLTGKLEATNEPYAIAKIAGIKLCESYNRQYGVDYRSVMPTNLYGPNDNYHPHNSHVIPALIRRFHQATQENSPIITIWGTGKPRREFLHVDDMAAACLHVMALMPDSYQACTEPMLSHINVGSGKDITIRELAELIAQIAQYQGGIEFDSDKPDGAPRKLMDVKRLRNLGWQAEIDMKDGIRSAYQWYVENIHGK